LQKTKFEKLEKKLTFHFQIAPFHYVKKTKHYDASKWPLSAAAAANPTAATAANSPQVCP